MDETVIETFDDVKFIEGVTKMNQANWQEYFSAGFPNGVYDGLEFSGNAYGPNKITNGTAFVNGLCVTIKTQEGYTEFQQECMTDRFFCLRVYLLENTAKLIMKTSIASEISAAAFRTEAVKFITDESYCCERSDVIYEIPLLYAGLAGTSIPYPENEIRFEEGIDLRRMGRNKKIYTATRGWHGTPISGDRKYDFPMTGGNIYGEGGRALLDIIDIADGATIRVTGGASDCTFAIGQYPASNSVGIWKTEFQPIKIIFETTSASWSTDTFGSFPVIKYNFTGGKTTLTLKIHFLGYTPQGIYASYPTYRFFLEELA